MCSSGDLLSCFPTSQFLHGIDQGAFASILSPHNPHISPAAHHFLHTAQQLFDASALDVADKVHSSWWRESCLLTPPLNPSLRDIGIMLVR